MMIEAHTFSTITYSTRYQISNKVSNFRTINQVVNHKCGIIITQYYNTKTCGRVQRKVQRKAYTNKNTHHRDLRDHWHDGNIDTNV